MRDILEDFISSIDDGKWSLEVLGEAPEAGKRPPLSTINWLRPWLRKAGPTPQHIVLAAAKRAGYREDLVEGCVFRNRSFVATGNLWSIRPTAAEWLAEWLLTNGEQPVEEVLAAGYEAGFRKTTLSMVKCNVDGFRWRKINGGNHWRIKR